MKLEQEHAEEKQVDQPYLDGWLKNTLDQQQKSTHNSNPAYLDGWLKNSQEGKQKSTQNSNPVYLDGWLKNTMDHQQKSTHDSNPAYLDGWLKNSQEGKQKSTHNSNLVYLDGWLKDTQDNKEKVTHNCNQVYLDGWLKDSQDQKGKTTHNSNQAYLDGWLKDTQDKKEKPTTHNTNQVYLDGWLKDSHSLPENYKKIGQDLAELKGKQSSKVDHREAFKSAFFTLDDLYVGNVMTLQFPIRKYARFLPRKQADSIPFSKSQFPSLLQLFSLTEDSPQGEDMKDIIDQCEFEPTKGETKACLTSLESMLDFVRSVLGAEASYNILTTSYATTSGARLQNYTVLKISKDIHAPKWVACHPRPYPYALYYCHYLDIGSKVFKVVLGGEYGDIMDALGICHLDTSDMNPNHIIFQQLEIKPGEAPLCHFFPVKHLLWAPLPPEATM
ncbi:BURP domain [Sesbania bispinosa]|nr:BURP domain [Sesbania bispinosa]